MAAEVGSEVSTEIVTGANAYQKAFYVYVKVPMCEKGIMWITHHRGENVDRLTRFRVFACTVT